MREQQNQKEDEEEKKISEERSEMSERHILCMFLSHIMM